jgi:hypothetical protein
MIQPSDSVLRATVHNIRARDRSRAWDRHDFGGRLVRPRNGGAGLRVRDRAFGDERFPFRLRMGLALTGLALWPAA